MAFKLASSFDISIEDIFIYEAQPPMQTVLGRVKNFLGFKFGFERFNEQAINVIHFARQEASRREHTQVEPEDLFAGLLADPSTASAHLLQVSGAEVNSENSSHSSATPEKLKLSATSDFVLELALQIVRVQGKRTIGTEHLLWGLLRLTETKQTQLSELFQAYGIDREALNHQLVEAI